jgi:hypothetical protein
MMPLVNRRQAFVGALSAALATRLMTSARAQDEGGAVTVAELERILENPARLATALDGVVTFIYIVSVTLDQGERLAESIEQFRQFGNAVFSQRVAIGTALKSAETLQSLIRYRPRIDAMKEDAKAVLGKGAIGEGPVRRSLLHDLDTVSQLLAASPRHIEGWWCHSYALRRLAKC